jgi:hypothetical protein
VAIQINKDVQTADGFTVQPFAFLDIQLYQPFSRALITYYKDEAAYQAGQSPVSVPSLPSLSDSNLTAEEFWGTELATVIHERAIAVIEEVIGAGTCTIVSL